MTSDNHIPQAVSDILGTTFPISFLGMRDGCAYYRDVLPDEEEIGFPTVVAYKQGSIVDVKYSFEALRLIDSFVE